MKNTEGVLVEPKHFEIQDAPMPEVKPNELLIKVHYVGLCGSDIHGFEFGPFIPPKDKSQKIRLGHEFSGEVVGIGDDVEDFKIGDKVILEPGVPCGECEYCRTGRYHICPDVDFLATQPNYRGALTEYIAHPAKWAYKVPDGMSMKEGALVEPAAVGMHAAVLGKASLGSHILILGAGTIGLMTLQACRSLGSVDISVVDVIPKRLEAAKKFGAKNVINGNDVDLVKLMRSDKFYGDHGVDLVFECSGSNFLAQQAIDVVARGGQIIMVGTQSEPVPIDFLKINREVNITTSFRYCNNFPQTIEAISSGKLNVKDMISNVYEYKDSEKAFLDSIDPDKKANTIKNVVRIAGTED